jgi:TonB-dependent receptor
MKLNRLAFTTCTGALAVALATPAVAGEVQGFVVDASETVALQAAEVRIAELGRIARAERDGSFYFADVPAGTYTVTASYIGAAPVSQSVTVPATGAASANFLLGGDNASQILVIGQSANLAGALSRKRASDVVSDGLNRDAIGQFPDQNVAESLRRLPGVNILNDQGEGRFVSVRGLDPELNATSLNGVRLPAPESDVRSVALDVISSDIIESIEVKKSLTPDMDADTIGASIEIETTSAFDRKKDLYSLKLEGSYNEYADSLTPKGSVDFATRISDSFGISGGVSYYKRRFETDNIEADDWEMPGSSPFATALEYRDYDVTRERISATLGLDFKVGTTTELYVKGIWSQFDDQEYRRRTTFDLGDFDGGASSENGSQFTFSDADNEFTVERDIKDRFERQRIRSVVVGGESKFPSGWFAEYSASYAKSTELEDGSIDPTQFERDFDGDGLTIGVDYTDPRVPLYSVSGAGVAPFVDPAEYELNDIEFVALSDAQDEEYAAAFDIGHEMPMEGGTFTVQAGFKGRWREKSYDKTVEFYEYNGPGSYTLADVLGLQTYRLTDIMPVADKRAPRQFFVDNFGDFEFVDDDSFIDSANEDFVAEEDVLAGYLLGRYDSATLRIIGGVRYEDTKTDLSGNLVDEDGPTATPVFFERDYSHWLPSLNIRFEAQPELILRAAGYRSIVRPKLSKFAPRLELDDDDEATFGNPNLKPYEAWNFDATAEYYFNSNGAATAGFFYKDIKNYIVDTVIEGPTTINGILVEEAEIATNGPTASVWGVELGFSQSFDFLPGLLSGFLVQANYTYTDAEGTIPNDGDPTDLRTVPLPGASKHTFNAALGYEKGPISLRLAGTYRDSYLDPDEIGSSADSDRYVDDHFQLDFSAKYKLTDHIRVFYEWVNINNAKYFAYNTLGGQQNLYQYEEYNWTMKFGAKVTF